MGSNRREFLGKSLGGLTALGAGVVFASPVSAACRDPLPLHWDETVDVLVVGTGFAGLAAACQAAELGAKVLVL